MLSKIKSLFTGLQSVNPSDTIRKTVRDCFIVLVVVGTVVFTFNSYVNTKVDDALTKQKLYYDTEIKELNTRNARKIDFAVYELKLKNKDIESKYNAQIKTLNSRISTLTDSLRNRPERPTSTNNIGDVTLRSSGTFNTKPHCDGSGLYRQDGEFLARYAGVAQQAKIEYSNCLLKYNNLVDVLKKIQDGKPVD